MKFAPVFELFLKFGQEKTISRFLYIIKGSFQQQPRISDNERVVEGDCLCLVIFTFKKKFFGPAGKIDLFVNRFVVSNNLWKVYRLGELFVLF